MNVHDAVFTFGDSRATMAALPRAAVLCWRSAVPDRWRRAMGRIQPCVKDVLYIANKTEDFAS